MLLQGQAHAFAGVGPCFAGAGLCFRRSRSMLLQGQAHAFAVGRPMFFRRRQAHAKPIHGDLDDVAVQRT